ncbi:YybS family protein [Mesobacillus zeae]|uniref:DUF2232 domain-containing protein n=1 Tax=Mesobacillus zeae TaxID=1917180 RepID=A0A398B9V3_9BACI|nr:YybS family protein [Mesobacillus zeae]RID86607.1 DUF2232 domain-containing protein [Mesobacillus zeae]
MKNTYKLTEGAALLAVFSVLLLMTLYIPVVGSITSLFLPLPFIMYAAKSGWKSSAVFMIAAILLSLIIGSWLAIPFTLSLGLTGIVMGLAIREKKSRQMVYVAGSLVFLVNIVAIYGISVKFFDINFIKEMMDALRRSIDMSIGMLKGMGQPADEKMIQQWTDSIDLLEVLLPSLFVIFAFVNVLITQLVSFPILKRFGIQIAGWKPFREITVPKSVLWYYLLTLLASMLFKPEEGTYWYIALANLVFILQFLMVIQGLSFLFYVAYFKGYSKAWAVAAAFLAFLIPIVFYIIRILGIIDIGFDLRKRLGRNDQK